MEIMTNVQADIEFNIKDYVDELVAFRPLEIVGLLVDVSSWENKPTNLEADGRLRKEAMECEAWTLKDGEVIDLGIVRVFQGPVFDALKVPLHRNAALAAKVAQRTGQNGWVYTYLDTSEAAAINTFAAKLNAHLA